MKYKSKLLLKTIPVIIFGIVIFVISSLRFDVVSGEKEKFDRLAILHIGEFGLFSMLLMYSFYPKIKTYYLLIFSILYGISDEIHQYFVPTRYFDVMDIICNCVGSILGIIGFFILTLIFIPQHLQKISWEKKDYRKKRGE